MDKWTPESAKFADVKMLHDFDKDYQPSEAFPDQA
jgi:hypothetical protein